MTGAAVSKERDYRIVQILLTAALRGLELRRGGIEAAVIGELKTNVPGESQLLLVSRGARRGRVAAATTSRCQERDGDTDHDDYLRG